MAKKDYQSNFIAKVPNNEVGKNIIMQLRKYLNRGSYQLRIRGSKPIPEMKGKYSQSIPQEFAQELRIYLQIKTTYTGRSGNKTPCVSSCGIQDILRERSDRKRNWELEKENQDLKNTILNLKELINQYQKKQTGYTTDEDQHILSLNEEITELKTKNVNLVQDNHLQKKVIADIQRQLAIAKFESESEKICDVLCEMFVNMGVETPDNFDDISEWVIDDLCHRRGIEWKHKDVTVSFKRWCESQE